ncbi:GNAT family N-acetyltransferase [Actinomadura decatromicini]|uniref:GNAT family N-acetyltransferase n=1 Tax=Actinomadura decatromicini TaxID=2604572 RepID=A0A5D3FRU3_9ACTN|nr:GNAT family N-acetyltransferase [Actinomadura decatromicini]TYK50722.1 GNAT family N-acetyltransferase [Actinomadura decatromicini]
MSEDVTLTALDQTAALDALDELATLYEEIYAEPPYNSAPKFSGDRFLARTREQILTSGFASVVARRGERLRGFTFGFTMAPGAWWATASAPPGDVLASDKFAVVELVVAVAERGQGLGRGLLDELLRERKERYATLPAVIGTDAYAMYVRWGWEKAAEFREEPPFSDALVRPLVPKNDPGPPRDPAAR